MPLLERSPEIKVHYETSGKDGPWITLVNGYARPSTDFKAISRFLSERGHQVLTFDSRGAGKTDCPPGFTLAEIAEDITALWDHLKIERSHLLGISFGGTIAITHAANSSRVSSLIVVSTAVCDKLLNIEKDPPPRDPRRLIMNFTRYFSKEFATKNSLLVQGFIRQVARTFQDPELALGARAQRDAMGEFDLKPLLPQISCPCLVLHGEADQVVSVDSGRKIASGIKSAKLESFAGIGHLLLVEMPTALYERVHRFLQESSPK